MVSGGTRKHSPPQGQVYRSGILVRFGDCDSARMVFYPRYLEMFNNLVEDWFREGLHLAFDELHAERGWGLPTVHLDVDFLAPSRLGEVLQATLTVSAMGKSSIGLDIVLRGPDEVERVRGKVVLVLVRLRSNRALTIPGDLRKRIAAYRGSSTEPARSNLTLKEMK